MLSILELPRLVAALSLGERARLGRIFRVADGVGELKLGPDMVAWAQKTFGDIQDVSAQRIIRVDNIVTGEGALFNALRAKRPMATAGSNETRAAIDKDRGDAFCTPGKGTPEDPFGRISGRTSVSASNIAKFDGHHGLVIFAEHDPLSFDAERIEDAVLVALQWIRKVHLADKSAQFPFLMWNCLWKSGASLIHGHMQVLVARDRAYAGFDGLNAAVRRYDAHHASDYFDDLLSIHRALDLGVFPNAFCSIAPLKEKETVIVAHRLGRDVFAQINTILHAFVRMGVESFNVAFVMPPLVHRPEWRGFPHLIRVVDRGSLANKTTDIGAMELFGKMAVIASDPYRVAQEIRKGNS